MKLNKIISNRQYRIFLFLIPTFYFILSYYFNAIYGLFYFRSVDPEYAYFISSLNIAMLKFRIGHIDHPGSPLQYIMALCFRLKYLFSSSDQSFVETALMHSESYLRTANLFLNLLLAIFLVFVGYKSYQLTSNFGFAALLQTTPFITQITYDTLGRIVPEPVILFPVLLLSLLLIGILYGKYESDFFKTVLCFGLISGFTLSVKLTCLPLVFIPFIVISKWKNKLIYSGITLISFLIFAIPVTVRINTFFRWGKSLFLHDGIYGGGGTDIINLQSFFPNMKSIVDENSFFFVLVFGLGLCTLVYFLMPRKDKNKDFLKIGVALIIAVLIQLVMVGKHFGYRYFIPALFLYPIIVITAFKTISLIFNIRNYTKISTCIIVMFLIITGFTQSNLIQKKATYLVEDNMKKLPLLQEVDKLEVNSVKLIIPRYSGSAAHEYAMFFSYAWAGGWDKAFYKEKIGGIYPDSYIYLSRDSKMYYFGQPDLSRAFEKNIPIYLIAEESKKEDIDNSINKLLEVTNFSGNGSPETIYQSQDLNAAIYRIKLEKK
ncbi:hypothetical protein [Mariniphaga sediminis]|uniref:hypothetical protein n=1 Tax=Mariniphaga sediminis TaxID=1628158 RepID=UPI0035646122